MVFGSSCVVCGDLGGTVCATCEPVVDLQRRTLPGGLTCISGGQWADDTAMLMLALKEDGVTRVARHLAPLLAAAHGSASGVAATDATLVPVPTRMAADRRRGYRPVEVLLRAAGLPFQRALRVATTVRDQRELSRVERVRNTLGAFAVRKTLAEPGPVILVDDVVTTGATLENSAQTLRSAGFTVVASITVLSTPKRLIRNS